MSERERLPINDERERLPTINDVRERISFYPDISYSAKHCIIYIIILYIHSFRIHQLLSKLKKIAEVYLIFHS